MLNFKSTSYIALSILGLIVVSEPFIYISLWWYVLLFLIWFWVVLIGSFSMSWGFFLKSFTSNSKLKEKKIALTFDDGPNSKYTLKVLKLLEDYDAKATFFCIGKHIEKLPKLLEQIKMEGHSIGNHSYSHRTTIDFKSTQGWLEELKNTDQAIYKVIGQKPTLFRPPYGVTTPHLAKAIRVTGHYVIGWNIRSFDMALKNPKSILKRLTKSIKPGSIILLHDSHEHIETVLEQLLQFLKKNDYQMVTVNELMNEN